MSVLVVVPAALLYFDATSSLFSSALSLKCHLFFAHTKRRLLTFPLLPRRFIVEAYVDMRQQDKEENSDAGNGEQGDQAAMTARALLSILRLSQALARLHFSEVVRNDDVEEAIRITHMSKASLMDQQDGGAGMGGAQAGVSHDQTSKIFGVMRDAAVAANAASLNFRDIEAAVLRKGFSLENFYETLEEYAQLNVIMVDSQRTRIDFVG